MRSLLRLSAIIVESLCHMFETCRICAAYYLADVRSHHIASVCFERNSRVRIIWTAVPVNRRKLSALNGNAKFWTVEAYPAVKTASFTYV